MTEDPERLRQGPRFWGALAVFATISAALAAASLAGTFFEDYTVWFRLLGLGGILICFVIGLLALALEPLRRFSGYLGRGIRASVTFIRENLLLVASVMIVTLLLWRLFYLSPDTALFSIVSLLVVGCMGMTVGLIRLLASTRPSFLGLPLRAEESREAPAVPKGLWSYDFIEYFDDPSTIKSYEEPWNIQVKRRAQSVGMVRPAIFEHPRSSGQTVLTYVIEQIPEHVGEVQLEFFTGILDELWNEATGQFEEASQFHTVAGNRIEFEIWVNEGRVFREVRDEVGWSEFKRVSGLTPFSGALEVSFRTDALGNPYWNWAAWGEARLVEVKPPSSAAG